jgi:hypothetical protein
VVRAAASGPRCHPGCASSLRIKKNRIFLARIHKFLENDSHPYKSLICRDGVVGAAAKPPLQILWSHP